MGATLLDEQTGTAIADCEHVRARATTWNEVVNLASRLVEQPSGEQFATAFGNLFRRARNEGGDLSR